MISIIEGIMNAIARFVNNCVPSKAVFASLKRRSSYVWRLKARTTDIPVSISRAMRFTLSIKVCMILNFGIVIAISMPLTITTSTIASPMIQLMETLV